MKTNRILTIAGCLIGVVIARSILPDGFLFSTLIFALLATALYNGYTLYQMQQQEAPNPFSPDMNNGTNTRPAWAPSQQANSVSKMLNTKNLLLAVCIASLILYRVTGPIAFYFFSVGDNLNFTYRGNPYIIWTVYGIFAGAIVGGFVAVRKFKLKNIYALYPAFALVLLIVFLVIYNASFKSHDFGY
ncbi:hypothetical protein [Mucilaginibacter auburnensis]|uniref:Uncharacterized protein n=1 Tax=Mucilaginibacter auburnensis TaxID=1457233 RepID=A0A2H9VRR7_9SPHI|nr:hypothetical protein [Mucilaginibacter auburnensis]PJJ83513.1 hypothetical protein CLV57_0496 [Mucilaginibacter auburnensis]